jgi:hypothetical protein
MCPQRFVAPGSFEYHLRQNDTIGNTSLFIHTPTGNTIGGDQNACGNGAKFSSVHSLGNRLPIENAVRIQIHELVLTSGIHLLPSFAERWEMKLHFSTENNGDPRYTFVRQGMQLFQNAHRELASSRFEMLMQISSEMSFNWIFQFRFFAY